MVKYDLNRPWLTLDKWQKDYINTDQNQNCFLLCGRQVGKTTAMSIKAVELCMKHFKKGEFVLINSITEKQAYHMLAKALSYAETKYSTKIDKTKDNKPTKHRLLFKNGTGILCYAAGETGEGLRGFTIKKLMSDEGSRMSEEYFLAVQPMLSVINGSMDISSTPFGKKHPNGTEKFFYKCSKDKDFKKFYISAEDCPRHPKKFLDKRKERLSRLAYAQEYLAVFTDELMRLISDDLIKEHCTLKKREHSGKTDPENKYYLGVDVAGLGKDDTTFEVVEKLPDESLIQKENLIERKNKTTETTQRILNLNRVYNFKKIGIDDGGLGFGVWSELMDEDSTKRKTEALNNASRPTDREGKKSKRLLKEEMYITLVALMESGKIKLFDDNELKASLSSLQYDEDGKIFGSDTHIAEGLSRGVYLAIKDKSLKIFVRSF